MDKQTFFFARLRPKFYGMMALLTALIFHADLRDARAATPLATVHPSYTLTSLHSANFRPDVGGMAFLSDGRLVIGSWGGTRSACCPSGTNGGRQYTGKVYVLSGVTADNPNVSVDTIASGLEDLMGLTVVNDVIYVSGGNRILRLVRDGNSGPVTRVDTVFILPGTPQSTGPEAGDSLRPVKGRSEWMYGMLARSDTFFVNPSSMYQGSYMSGLGQVNPFRGRQLAVSLGDGAVNKRGSFVTRATGFRHPTGLTFGPEGSMWTVETQGNWVPTNKLIHLKSGAHYGYRHNGIPADDSWDNLPETPAAVFMPQEGGGGSGNKNASGVFSNSPGAPLYLTHGPYAGQIIMGDVSWGGIQRFFVEKVNGEYQGVGFAWMGGLEGSAYRLLEGTDGQIYVGMLGTTGDWSWNGQLYGLQKLKYNGTPTFEMLAVRSRAQGMEVEFTLPVDTAAAKLSANWQVQTYYYQPTAAYGGNKIGGATNLSVSSVQISPDRKRAYLAISGLVARTGTQHRIVQITLGGGIRSATAAAPRTDKAYYTLNAISTSTPFSDTGTVSVDPRLARQKLDRRLAWTRAGENLRVQVPFRGEYELRLTNMQGRVLASASGRGEGTQTLRIGSHGTQIVLLEARGDGVRLQKTVVLP